MTALAAIKDDKRQDGRLLSVPVKASVNVHKGALLTFQSGYAAPATAASQPVAGVAIESLDNTSGSNGAGSVRVHRDGIFSFACSGASQTSVGLNAFASDDQTVTIGGTTAGNIPIGVVVGYVSATEVRVALNVSATALPDLS